MTVPATDGLLGVLVDGYEFVAKRCERRGVDVFETRLGPVPVICMRGRQAGEVFYSERFRRRGVAPARARRTLFGEGGVQGLDGAGHHHRKQLFLSLMTPEALADLAAVTDHAWELTIDRWQRDQQPVVLFEEAGQLLCRVVHDWAGVPLPDDEVAGRTAELHALIDSPARLGPGHWRGRVARRRADRWASRLVDDVRAGRLATPEDRALARIAGYRDGDGELLDARVAGVELLNVLRPTVAIDRYVVFAALALQEHPRWRERLQEDDDAVEWFVQEVRRHYPFFPAAAAKVAQPFEWHGVRFPEGRLVLYDLYATNHDPAIWDEPSRFDPERFRDRKPGSFELVPQGGGDHASGHRCAGEWLTIDQMKIAARTLARRIDYSVPAQDLRVSLRRMPTLPNSGFVMTDIHPRT